MDRQIIRKADEIFIYSESSTSSYSDTVTEGFFSDAYDTPESSTQN